MAITTRSPMQVLTRPTAAPGTSLAYLTIGAVMAVLAGTSYFFFNGAGNPVANYVRELPDPRDRVDAHRPVRRSYRPCGAEGRAAPDRRDRRDHPVLNAGVAQRSRQRPLPKVFL